MRIDRIAPNPVQPPSGIVAFDGSTSDAAGAILAVEWRSNLDGRLSHNEDFTTSSYGLTVGSHTITFTAWDDEGTSSSDATTLTIVNALPTATISSMLPDPVSAASTVTVVLAGQDRDEMGQSVSAGELTKPGGVQVSVPPGTYRFVAPLLAGDYWVQYRVRDDEAAWSLPTSRVLHVVPPPLAPVVAPEPPYTSGTANTIAWAPPVGSVGCLVQWSADPSFVAIVGNSAWTSATACTATSLIDGRTYYYRVKSRNAAMDESVWSNVVSSTQDASAPAAPGTPTDAGAYTSSTTLRFNWTAAVDVGTSGSGVASYDLQVGTTPGGSDIFSGNVGNVLTLTVTGSNGQTLNARARARDRVGNIGPWSGNSNGILIDTAAPTAPGIPTALGAYTSSTMVRFDWAAAADNGSGVASYDLQVGTTPGGSDVLSGNVGNVLTRTVTGSNGQTLYARVRARDQAGNIGPWSASSNGILVDTAAPSAPGRPTDAGVYTSSTMVRFDWVAAADSGAGVASYDLQVGTAPGASDIFSGNVGNVLTRTVTGSNGQTLYARARARDKAGNVGPWSPNSDGILIDTVAPTGPGAPTDAGAFTSSTSVRFNWAAATDAGSGLASYDLQVGTAAGASNVFNGNVGNLLTRTVTGSNGRALYARVRARDRVGNIGLWSPSSDGILIDTVRPTTPSAPTDIGAFTSSTAVQFRWTAVTDPGTTPSGVGWYELWAGTAPGSSNVFKGNVGNVLSKVTTGADSQTLYARVRAVDRAGNIGPWSGDSNGITIDTSYPYLTSAAALTDTTVDVTFDEPVINALTKACYTITRSLAVVDIQRLNDTQYRLHTNPQTPGTSYTLTARNIRDRAGNLLNPSPTTRSFRGGPRTGVGLWNLYR